MSQENVEYTDSFWDNVNIGDFRLNHSENFFAKNRPKFIQMKSSDKENNPNAINSNVDDKTTNDLATKFDQCVLQSKTEKPAPKPVQQTIVKNQEGPTTRSRTKTANAGKPTTATTATTATVTTFLPAVKTSECKLYDDAKKYAAKKQRLLEKLKAEEKEARSFKSKPPPNFKKMHHAVSKHLNDNRKLPTCPNTPRVLKISNEAEERKAKKMEEYVRQQQPRPFIANEVVKKTPFKPKLESHTVEPAPFNLHVMTRLRQRKLYDESIRKCMEEKNRQKEEEDRVKNLEMKKEFRKMTEFKARPNPFSSEN